MSKKTYITVNRIETRNSKREKSVIKPNTKLELTAAEAKKYGAAVVEVVEDEQEEIEDDDTGEGNGSEGGGA
ncbi:hypothetical protein ACJO2E_08555 [Marinobacter sp. M1N3S26]|uniref:hypothetical protein n=1 Tax=Marinobacter sp. M1N3S26 TaxID=3382299 RepID=UPI00387A9743